MSARDGSVCWCNAATIRADRIARAASDRDGRPPAAPATRLANAGPDNCVWANGASLFFLIPRVTHYVVTTGLDPVVHADASYSQTVEQANPPHGLPASDAVLSNGYARQ
jgi:hypothetical protein